jgi:hypothetical protein
LISSQLETGWAIQSAACGLDLTWDTAFYDEASDLIALAKPDDKD